MPLRLYILVSQGEARPDNVDALVAHRMVDYGNGHLTVRGIGEITSDGALGSRSAWMLKPYDDDPTNTGLNVTTMARIKEIAEIGIAHGFQISVHAIGDRANRETLDTYESVFKEHHVKSDTLRWRIEHAQHLNPADIPRFGKMGVVASMQAIHAMLGCAVRAAAARRAARRGGRVRLADVVEDRRRRHQRDRRSGGGDQPDRFVPLRVTREAVGTDSAFFPAQKLAASRRFRRIP